MDLELGSAFAECLDDDVVVCDVGARWGIEDRWSGLAGRVRIFGFDPDAIECERLNALAEPGVQYIPVALGSSAQRSTLHHTIEPACSSLYKPIDELADNFPELECTRAIGSSYIDLDTLDRWRFSSGIARVDVIKLDTQGSELDILFGSIDTLEETCLLEIEVEFNTIYEGQPLFSDVDQFMRRQGFVLWKLAHLVHYSDRAVPGGTMRFSDIAHFDSTALGRETGAGQLYWGHAYFIPDVFSPASTRRPDWLSALRLAACACSFRMEDLAIIALNRAEKTPDEQRTAEMLESLIRATA